MSTDSRTDFKNPAALAERGAPLVDRLLAFGFDLCLWSPAALLIGKPFWRDFHYHQSLSPGSTEALMFFGFGLFAALVFVLVVQTLCVWRWGATPGKKVFLLEVVHVNGGLLTLGQSFTRACAQIFEILCFAIPCLEVVSHPERRPWHDRLAESRVITRKEQKFEAPHALESRFFRNLYWGFGLSLFVFAFAGLTQLRHQVKLGALKRGELEKNAYLCETKTKIPAHSGMTTAQARLDFMLAQFEAGKAERECLENEADFAIWTQAEETQAWAHLIRGALAAKPDSKTTDEETANQFAQACPALTEAPDETAPTAGRGLASAKTADEELRCELARYYQGDAQTEITDRTWTGQIIQLKQAFQRGDFDEIGKVAVKNPWPLELADYVQEMSLKALALKGADSEFREGMTLLAPAWTEARRFRTMAWACFSSITKTCGIGGESPTICRALRTELETAGGEAWTPDIAMTFQLESRCHNRKDVVVETQAKARLAADEETHWALEPKKASLKTLKSVAQDHWARPYLLWWLSRDKKNAGDELALEFQRGQRNAPDWWLAYQAFDHTSDSPLQEPRGLAKDGPQLKPVEELNDKPKSRAPAHADKNHVPANAEGREE